MSRATLREIKNRVSRERLRQIRNHPKGCVFYVAINDTQRPADIALNT